MDIDEFLDRELSELDLATDNHDTENIEDMQSKEDFEPSSMFSSIRSLLVKGSIDEAERIYIELWRALLNQKLKWNVEMYEQLASVSKEFIKEINRRYSEIKKKSDDIHELIRKARSSLKEGGKDLPYKIYSQVIEINNSIPNVFFEEKKIIQDQVALFYEELRNITDNELIKRVSQLVMNINSLIERINFSIGSGNFYNAVSDYNKCLPLYSQVPEGFLKSKALLGIRILEIYKNISINMEISSLKQQIYQKPSTRAMPEKLHFPSENSTANLSINEKKDRAKKNIEKGFYGEASKEIEEILKVFPNDAEAKVMHAKIKTMQ